MIDGSFVKEIVDLATPATFTANSVTYSTKTEQPIQDPLPAIMQVHSLSGLVDYLTSGMDFDLDKSEPPVSILISDHESVTVFGELTENSLHRRAFCLAAPVKSNKGSIINRFVPVADMMIALQTRFVQDETMEKLMSIIGNVRGEDSRTFADDGVSQTATVKSGGGTLSDVPLPKRVMLKPFRTFLEIEQPESEFVLRMDFNNEDDIRVALFETDDLHWRIKAMEKIKDWLAQALGKDDNPEWVRRVKIIC